MRYTYFLPVQVTRIERKLRDGDGLLEIFFIVTMAEDFRGPRNSSMTAVRYGKCQWVFKSILICAGVVSYLFHAKLIKNRD